MLRKIRVLDYHVSYTYAPPQVEAIVNTDEIISAVPCESRCCEPTMRLNLRDGSHLIAIGQPSDLLEAK